MKLRLPPPRLVLVSALGLALAGGIAASASDSPPPAQPVVAPYKPPTAADTAKWCGEQAVGVRSLVDQLRHRAVELDEREQTIGLREAALNEAAKRIEERLAILEKAQAGITTCLDEEASGHTVKVAALVKMIESNRAKSIAPMFAALDPGLAVEVLDGMNRTKAGKLLAELPPPQAAALASRMINPIQLALR